MWCAGEWELVISQLGITAKTKANNDCSFGVRNGAFAQRKHFRKLFSGKCGEEENFLFGREIKSIMIRIGKGRRPGYYCDSPPQKWGSGIYNNGFSFLHLPFSIAFSRLFLCEIALGWTSIVPNGRIRQICIFPPLLAKVLPLIGLGNFDPLVDRGSQNWSLSDHNWKEEKWWLGA